MKISTVLMALAFLVMYTIPRQSLLKCKYVFSLWWPIDERVPFLFVISKLLMRECKHNNDHKIAKIFLETGNAICNC